MWIMFVIVLAVLAIGVGSIYLLLKNMGQNGIEAAAPGSCRSGRCGVTPSHRPAPGDASSSVIVQTLGVDEITRKDARSPNQLL